MAIPPPILVMRHRSNSGGTMQPLRYQGATQADIGTAFGSAVGYNVDHSPRNHVIQFGGNLYAVGNDGIYKKDDPTIQTGSWTIDYTYGITPITGGMSTISGLYPVNIGGTASLMMVYRTVNSTSWRIVTFDGSSWSETGTITSSAACDTFKSSIIYRNQLHIIGEASASFHPALVFNPATGTVDSPSEPFSGADDPSMCIFNDRLFAQYQNGNDRSLAEYTGTWTFITNIYTPGVNPRTLNYRGAQSALMTDGTYMYAFWGINNPSGTQKCIQIDNTLTPTDITGTVLPASLTSITAIEAATAHWMCVYDTNTSPGSSQPWLYYAANDVAGTTFTVFEWVNDSTEMVVQDTGGDVAHSLPTEVAGGERIWTAGELDIKITGVSAGIGGEVINFMAYGDPGSADKTVTFQWTNEGEPTTNQATLTGTATGGSAARSGNSVINVDADGTTTYTITWDTITDSPGGRAQLTPVISA